MRGTLTRTPSSVQQSSRPNVTKVIITLTLSILIFMILAFKQILVQWVFIWDKIVLV
jgi:hypothetical protein